MSRHEKLYTILGGLFVAIVLISTIASSKMTAVGPFIFDAGTILFPLSYIIASILTEAYGLRRAELVIATGLIAQLLACLTFIVVGLLPAYGGWDNQDAYMAILGIVPRIAVASIIAYIVGELCNVRLLAHLKQRVSSRSLRIGIALFVSQLIDTALFSTIAFAGTMPIGDLFILIGTVFLIKCITIAVLTPMSARVIERIPPPARDRNTAPKTTA